MSPRRVATIEGANAAEKAARLVGRLKSRGALTEKKGAQNAEPAPDTSVEDASNLEVWVVAELMDGKLRRSPSSF